MSKDGLPHLADKPLAEVCQAFPLGDEARALLRSDLTVRPYLDVLMKERHYLDAVRLLAHALPKREAVWWACHCARMVARGEPPEAEARALEAAEAWAASPGEDARRAAMTAAEAAGFASPAGCAAAAAFSSGGSLAPPNVPAVPPADHLTAHFAASSVLFAAVISEPEKAEEKYRAFVDQGIAVAAGQLRWNEATGEVPAPATAAAPIGRPARGPSRPVIDWG